MSARVVHFIKLLQESNLDAYLITNNYNIVYLTGFPASDSWLFITRKKSFYITDARYTLEAKQGLKGIAVKEYSQSIIATLFELADSSKVKNLGFDNRHVSLHTFQEIKKTAPQNIKLIVKNGLVESLRIIKEIQEVNQMRACLRLHQEAYRYLKGVVKPGLSETDVLIRLERFVKSRKAAFSFSPIIASGPNSCFPHAKVTQRKIRNNEPVLVDMGIEINGYKSDLTRMFFLGKMTALVREVNDAVDAARLAAIKAVKPEVKVADIDREARNFLANKRLSKYFNHSLGHGVGLEIHEAPRISQKSTEIIKPGMVFTIEPAVYIPNQFGIRIEDMVLVKDDGCEVLSR